MGQIVKSISSIQILPDPIRQYVGLADSWTGTFLPNGYTKISADTSLGNAIKKIVIGYGRDDWDTNNPYYNDLATFGGQTTPVTPFLSPASDDSWAPRYQVAGQYQVTTQVPPQQTPMMTHVYSTGSVKGIWRVAYVIDDNNFVVYDPQLSAAGNFGALEIIPICQNTFATTNIAINADALSTLDFYYVQNNVAAVQGPLQVNFGANQEGIVEPFLIECTAGNCTAVITY